MKAWCRACCAKCFPSLNGSSPSCTFPGDVDTAGGAGGEGRESGADSECFLLVAGTCGRLRILLMENADDLNRGVLSLDGVVGFGDPATGDVEVFSA